MSYQYGTFNLLMDYSDEAFYVLQQVVLINDQNINFVNWYFIVHHNHDQK